MGLLDIFAKINLDSSSFHSSLKGVERGTEKFAHKMKHQIAGTVLGALGVHAIVHAVKELVDQAEKVDQLSKRFNLTTDEVQLLQQEAEETGATFESLVENADNLEEALARVHGNQVAISRENIEMLNTARQAYDVFRTEAGLNVARLFGLSGEGTELTARQEAFLEKDAAKKRAAGANPAAHQAMMDRVVEMEKQAADLTNKTHDAGLTKQQKMNELLARQAELRKENFKDWINEEAIAKKTLELAKNANEIAVLKKDMANDSVVKPLSPLADSLRSVGNFLGGDPNSGVVKHLSNMERQLEEIRRNTARNGSGTQFPI